VIGKQVGRKKLEFAFYEQWRRDSKGKEGGAEYCILPFHPGGRKKGGASSLIVDRIGKEKKRVKKKKKEERLSFPSSSGKRQKGNRPYSIYRKGGKKRSN